MQTQEEDRAAAYSKTAVVIGGHGARAGFHGPPLIHTYKTAVGKDRLTSRS
jgi:putative intracellular protease/amidase